MTLHSKFLLSHFGIAAKRSKAGRFSSPFRVNLSKSPKQSPVFGLKLVEICQELVFSLGCFFKGFFTLEGWMANALEVNGQTIMGNAPVAEVFSVRV